MKIHKVIDDSTADIIRQIALTKGLDAINFESCYRLYKVGEKVDKDVIEMIERRYVGQGSIQLVGSCNHVSVYIAGLREWFRTSEVLSCKKKDACIIIETKNSFYELVEDE